MRLLIGTFGSILLELGDWWEAEASRCPPPGRNRPTVLRRNSAEAERRCLARYQRKMEARRQRFCLSGRCRGHHPGSGGPARGGGEVRAARGASVWRRCASYQEGSKHGDGGQEVPDIVVVEEGKQDAVPVVLARLSWGFLRAPGAMAGYRRTKA